MRHFTRPSTCLLFVFLLFVPRPVPNDVLGLKERAPNDLLGLKERAPNDLLGLKERAPNDVLEPSWDKKRALLMKFFWD
ncbi:MAG: hypothetical protein J3R72DRAFT_447467 [Linnemannia gamsii]|nr:MAG: hypothetical protein J3R72DRAFT_447467 [Linnemannia gamsii]